MKLSSPSEELENIGCQLNPSKRGGLAAEADAINVDVNVALKHRRLAMVLRHAVLTATAKIVRIAPNSRVAY